MRKFLGNLFIVLVVLFFAGCFFTIHEITSSFSQREVAVHQPSILFLRLEGIILDGKEILEQIEEYADSENIKGVLIQVNSPGGVVGPSQEIYAELRRIRDELKKPVVVSVLSMAASGAYYVSAAANRIIVNPGSLVGSIGVIMEFANLEGLYDWAKIKRYVIKTGRYKDSGAEYREMREDEKLLFQQLADDVLGQFKKAIVESRQMKADVVESYSDGRVFTGQTAVNLGFADEVGTLSSAIKAVGQLSGLGEKPEIFEPPKPRPDYFIDLLADVRSGLGLEGVVRNALGQKLWGQPLFILPAALHAVGDK